MKNIEIVEAFIENFKKKYRKYILSQLVIDILLIILLTIAILKVMDNTVILNVTIIIAVLVMLVITFVNLTVNFGSLKKLNKQNSISVQYQTAKKEFDNAKNDTLAAKEKFDIIIDELAQKIKNLK